MYKGEVGTLPTSVVLTLSVRHGGVALPAGLGEAEGVPGGHAEHVGGEGLQAGHVVRSGVVLRLHGAAPSARRLALPEKEGGIEPLLQPARTTVCSFIRLAPLSTERPTQKDLRPYAAIKQV